MKRYVEAGYTDSGYIVGDAWMSAILMRIEVKTPTLHITKKITPEHLAIEVKKSKLFIAKNITNTLSINLAVKHPIKKQIKKLNYISLKSNINSFSYKKLGNAPKVVMFDGIAFKYPLIYEKNYKSSDYISQSTLAIDGSSIVSVIKKPRLTREYSLTGDYVYKDELITLFENISEDIIEFKLNNGMTIKAKYDLLNNPIEATPIYDGAEYYRVTIRILV